MVPGRPGKDGFFPPLCVLYTSAVGADGQIRLISGEMTRMGSDFAISRRPGRVVTSGWRIRLRSRDIFNDALMMPSRF